VRRRAYNQKDVTEKIAKRELDEVATNGVRPSMRLYESNGDILTGGTVRCVAFAAHESMCQESRERLKNDSRRTKT